MISTMIAAAFALQLGLQSPNDSRFTQYVSCAPVEQAQPLNDSF